MATQKKKHNDRDVMYMRWVIALCIGCVMYVVCDETDPATTILLLRNKQYYASCNDYREYEQEIQRIKHEHGSTYTPAPWFTWNMYIHAIPWVVWQAAVIILALLLSVLIPYVWHGKYSGLFFIIVCLLVVTTYIAWSGHVLAKQKRAVVIYKQAPIYLGPGDNYPARRTLKHLDEVTVLQRIEDWVKVRYTDTSGWIHADYIVDGSS